MKKKFLKSDLNFWRYSQKNDFATRTSLTDKRFEQRTQNWYRDKMSLGHTLCQIFLEIGPQLLEIFAKTSLPASTHSQTNGLSNGLKIDTMTRCHSDIHYVKIFWKSDINFWRYSR